MASIKTNVGRKKLAKAHAGTAALPPIKHIAFGDGGVDKDYNPKTLTGEEIGLFHELIRKIAVKSFPNAYTARYSVVLNADTDDLVGKNINEACLVDADGDVVAIKTMTNKGMEEKTEIEFDYDARF